VGAGGFSLRSRKLVEAVRDLRRRESCRDVETAEDVQICVTHRAALEAGGMRFATPPTAARFAFERVLEFPAASCVTVPTLGFHGVFNFPLLLTEYEILDLLDAIASRIPPAWPIWHLFVRNAWLRGYETLGGRLVALLAERDPRVWAKVVQACLTRGVPPRWLKAAA
jgi:hypothetical protein